MNHIISTFPSGSLKSTVTVNILLPKPLPGMGMSKNNDIQPPEKYKTLYLLHGAFESPEYFINYSDICAWVDANNIAVVMPNLGNSFYQDNSKGELYFTFITDELIKYTREILPLSPNREDTFIGGISMGGYGALKAGLRTPDTFGKVISVSGSVKTKSTLRFLKVCGLSLYDTKESLEAMSASNEDLIYCLINLDISPEKLPQIFMTWGDSDIFRADNVEFINLAASKGITIPYTTIPGRHEWNCWKNALMDALDFLTQQ